MNRSFVRIALGILLALIVLAGAGGGFIWWKMARLKEQLVSDLEKALGAKVQVTSLDLDIWKGELHAAGITLVNERPSAPWDKGDISQATVRFKMSDVFGPKLPVSVEVTSWSVALHSPLRTAETPPGDALSEPGPEASPGRVQVTQISAQEGTVEIDLSDDRKAVIHGVGFAADNNGAGVWTTKVQASSIDAGSLQAGASSVEILGEAGKLTFSNLRMQCDPGIVTGDGEVGLDGMHEAKATFKAVDVPVSMLVGVAWQMKLAGLASGDLEYDGNDQGGDAKGQMAVNHGKFNVLPWLGKVTSMVGLPDVSDVEVDKATTDFEWKNSTVYLTNLDIRKDDVTRIAGEVEIDANNQVDGKIKLGLPSVVTAKWPQLQAKVFPVELEDYNWADVHLTGTPDHLQEDLTPRLVAAGLGTGSDLLNQATQKATDLFNNFMGK
ncbi:MAG: hypothetical protein LV480_04250 [Methylacidiphilales bacterium]|nr:hypothetical protein [Candidatus Methylacidiphilales bacterium]